MALSEWHHWFLLIRTLAILGWSGTRFSRSWESQAFLFTVLRVPEFLASGDHSPQSDAAGSLQPDPGVLRAALPLRGREPGGVWQIGQRSLACVCVLSGRAGLALLPLRESGAPAGRGLKNMSRFRIAPVFPQLYPHIHSESQILLSALPEGLTNSRICPLSHVSLLFSETIRGEKLIRKP